MRVNAYGGVFPFRKKTTFPPMVKFFSLHNLDALLDSQRGFFLPLFIQN